MGKHGKGGTGLFEKYLIEHCSPTLASLKTASLFCLAYSSEEDLQSQLEEWNRRLGGKGISLLALRRQERPTVGADLCLPAFEPAPGPEPAGGRPFPETVRL